MIYGTKGIYNQIVYAEPVGIKPIRVIAQELNDPTAIYVDFVNLTATPLPFREPKNNCYFHAAARVTCERIVELRTQMPDGANCEITYSREGKRETVRVSDSAQRVHTVVQDTFAHAPPIERQGPLEAVFDWTRRFAFIGLSL